MATIITMPAIVADATDAVLAVWLVEAGSEIGAGTPLADIETEKATVELESEASGRVVRLLVDAGAQVPVGFPIAVIAAPGDTDRDVEALLGADAARLSTAENAKLSAAGNTGQVAEVAGDGKGGSDRPRLFASPLARRLAKENGIDLSSLNGNGPGGRILRADVEAALQTASGRAIPKVAETAQLPSPLALPVQAPTTNFVQGAEMHPMSRMRQAIARRLTESKTQVPHFYLTVDVQMDQLLAMRRQINVGSTRKITVNDLIVRAIALALQQVPEANVAFAGDSIAHFADSDISVAIATEGGLVTPVIRAAQAQSISQISATIADFATRAQENKIRPAEIAGGTFTVSNLGMFGTKEFSAILNPPQSGILAVGAAEKRAVVVNEELAIASVMTCTLSADHRVVDGAVAARLMAKFKELMENPISTLL